MNYIFKFTGFRLEAVHWIFAVRLWLWLQSRWRSGRLVSLKNTLWVIPTIKFKQLLIKYKILLRYFFSFCLLLIIGLTARAQPRRFVFSANKMGSPFGIIMYAGDSAAAGNISRECFKLVDSLVNIFSDYIDSSELNRLCARAGKEYKPMEVSPALFDILLQSKKAYEKSKGTFDITLGPVTRLWRKARKEKRFPADSIVKEKLALTGFNKIAVDTQAHTVKLMQAGMQLDLGGIAQGYIAQQVINYLKAVNIETALVDVSGDILAIGAPPGTNGWKVGINVPEQKDDLLKKHLTISNKAVTTSGDVYQFMEHDGKRYSHVIDPHTGYGITTQKNVTVVANDGTTADWLTKACSILPTREAKKLARSFEAALLVGTIKKGKLFLITNGRFRRLASIMP